MPDIETRLLRSFAAVAAQESLSAAAETLGCSRGALSLRIHALEDRLGVRLFDRDPRGLRLTPVGRDLLADARAILEMHDRLFGRALHADIAGKEGALDRDRRTGPRDRGAARTDFRA